ncbi:MAG: hypothetical protein EZS28_036679 [Streblomastix strix]|uniref:Transmembrane protein n=1 Tax=Streblomastix strix TaxID=222440 RepID=A0A5J4UC47_9EUKA|nr:MAG: hypothetical protein EZS28_036679 [Streblomastix strix]
MGSSALGVYHLFYLVDSLDQNEDEEEDGYVQVQVYNVSLLIGKVYIVFAAADLIFIFFLLKSLQTTIQSNQERDFNNYESNYEELFNNQLADDQDDDEEEVSQNEEKFNSQDELEYAGEFAYQSGFELDNNEGIEGDMSGSDCPYDKENGDGTILVIEYGEICEIGDITSGFKLGGLMSNRDFCLRVRFFCSNNSYCCYYESGGIRFDDDTTLLLALIVRADCQTCKFGDSKGIFISDIARQTCLNPAMESKYFSLLYLFKGNDYVDDFKLSENPFEIFFLGLMIRFVDFVVVWD